MALVLRDRVQETGTANTTVSFTLAGAVTGYQSFSSVGNGNTTFYSATDASGGWEVGLGTYSTTGPTLTRTTVYSSSNSGSAVTFSGTVTVFLTYPSGRSVNLDASGNASALGTIASGTWQGSTVATAYGGTGVTTSTGANSNVLRDANQNITANNFLAGYSAVTAAGGITVLTNASAYYQRLSGSTTQTFQLPDATTCVLGQAFVFDNDSSGTLTVVDNASGAVDTIPSGGYGYIFAESVSTSAGSWGKYALLPATYDFNTTSADFGGATISNAVYNGTAIGTAYGGTGLSGATPFTSGGAVYANSASTLTSGTLPVTAGGTGVTSTPTNGQLLVGNGTNYTVATLGSGTGISTTTGAGTLQINNTGVTSAVAGTGISVSGATGAVTITNSGVTSVTGTAPVVSSGGSTPAISMAAATTSVNGYLTSTDWNTFNGKQAALVSGTNIKTINSNSILGSGNLSITASPGGSTTQVQYNSAGSFAGSANLTFDGTNLTCGGNVTANSDETLKTNWRNLPPDFIEQMAKVKRGVYDRLDVEATQVGVSAQSLLRPLKEAVLMGEDGKLSVAYGNAALVLAIELAERVVSLEARLSVLEK